MRGITLSRGITLTLAPKDTYFNQSFDPNTSRTKRNTQILKHTKISKSKIERNFANFRKQFNETK